ncbi:MAG TPA: TetR/AcrR family transcriptional regulator [Polyangiaceae bacterium]|nr:TetR/AcrR family transcriptional regulator [Polyangiaceae bacterium]
MVRTKDPLAPQSPPRPSREDSRQIVEAVIGATAALADPDASMQAIADRAGVGIASVYRYFPSKAAIYAELSRRLHHRMLDAVRAVLSRSNGDVESALAEVCRTVVVAEGLDPALRRCLNASVPLSWSLDSANEVFPVIMDEIVAWLEAHLAQPPTDLRERVFLAFATARGMVMLSMVFPELAPSEEYVTRKLVAATRTLLLD